jgi:hypothetical protein
LITIASLLSGRLLLNSEAMEVYRMKVIAFNGSPRKDWNTAALLGKALEGAASQGAETELFHLYDLNYKGCVSCFACKTRNGKSYGRCAVKDDLTSWTLGGESQASAQGEGTLCNDLPR